MPHFYPYDGTPRTMRRTGRGENVRYGIAIASYHSSFLRGGDGGSGLIVLSLLLAVHLAIIDVRTGTQ